MSGGEILFQGWLRKSPPERKLRRYVSVPHFSSFLHSALWLGERCLSVFCHAALSICVSGESCQTSLIVTGASHYLTSPLFVLTGRPPPPTPIFIRNTPLITSIKNIHVFILLYFIMTLCVCVHPCDRHAIILQLCRHKNCHSSLIRSAWGNV